MWIEVRSVQNRTSGYRRRSLALWGVSIVLTIIPTPVASQSAPPQPPTSGPDGQRDFEFEIGTWVMHRRHLVHTHGDSATWVESQGDLHIVRKVWGGRASLGELEIASPTPHFAGSILHLYNPDTHEWRLYWASSADGTVSAPLVGGFSGGRGEFYGQDTLDGASVFVRLVYSDITASSFRTEQAISRDGGRTWEPTELDSYARRTVN
jgi:hypothetical protein